MKKWVTIVEGLMVGDRKMTIGYTSKVERILWVLFEMSGYRELDNLITSLSMSQLLYLFWDIQ